MKKILLLSLVLFLLGASSAAEEKKTPPVKKNNLALQAGSKALYLNDKLFAPLNFSGSMKKSKGLSLGYRKQKGAANIFTLNASYYNSEISSEANNLFTAPMIQANASLSYHILISKLPSKTRLYLGPRYDFSVNFLDHSLNAGASSISLLTANSLSASVLLQKNIGKKSLVDLEISVPFYGLVYRPPYSVYTDELGDASAASLAFGGEFTGFKNYKVLNAKLNYNLHLSNTFQLITSYQFMMQRADLVKKYALGSHGLSIGINIKY